MLHYLRKTRSVIRKPAVQLEKSRTVRRRYHKEFAAAGVAPVPFKLAFNDEPRTPTEMILRKENGRITVVLSAGLKLLRLRFYSERVAAHVYWFSHSAPAVTEISADLSDGNAPSLATYRFSTTPNIGAAVPDPYFFATGGYRRMHAHARNKAPAWDDRENDIVWRGALNNPGLFSLDPATATNPGVQLRLRMAMACQSLDVDFRFVHQTDTDHEAVLKSAGLTARWQDPTSWGSKKYAIDVDGWTNAWNNFMQRLSLGCCVLKVGSQFGFYQWYYPRLSPWEHFIPIKSDLSDLAEQLDWARTHTAHARDIAAAGQALAQSMTLESEARVAARIIERHEARQ